MNKPDWGAIVALIIFGTIFTATAFVFGSQTLGIIFLVFFVILLFGALTTSKKEIEEQAADRYLKNQELLSKIKCPTCQSNDVERISTGKKAAYVLGFGILAPAFKKVRSQFECKSCGYKW